jgi:hypothetical protein
MVYDKLINFVHSVHRLIINTILPNFEIVLLLLIHYKLKNIHKYKDFTLENILNIRRLCCEICLRNLLVATLIS